MPILCAPDQAQSQAGCAIAACHGLFEAARPEFSSLALTPDAADDGFLTALEVSRLTVATDLVVLSACSTGRGRVVRGEGAIGLARAFQRAGAPRVVCALWKVNDAASAAFMTRFYAAYRPRDGTAPKSAARSWENVAPAAFHPQRTERELHPSQEG